MFIKTFNVFTKYFTSFIWSTGSNFKGNFSDSKYIIFTDHAFSIQGLTEIKDHADVDKQIDILHQLKTDNENDCLVLKSVMWALAHLATSNDGLDYLDEDKSRIIEKIIFLAKHCPVYSIRATAVHCLSLIGTTKLGADILYKKYGK